MRFTAASIVAFAAGALASASSSASVPVVTEVVTSYETYCPEATTFVAGSSTVSVTAVCHPIPGCDTKDILISM